MITENSPIGVFDSGVGGISVLRALRETLPKENFLFFGDSQNAPYGEKSPAQIRELADHSLRFLRERGAKAVIIACNTATSAAADYLRKKYPEMILIGMEPAIKPAALAIGNGAKPCVLVMATPATIRGERLHHLLSRYHEDADYRLLPAPKIVRFVEAGQERSDALRDYLRDILSPYRSIDDTTPPALKLDSIVLGCTHFPFIRQQLRECIGYPVAFFDGARGTARETLHRLAERKLLRETAAPGSIALFSSSGSTALMERLLQLPIE